LVAASYTFWSELGMFVAESDMFVAESHIWVAETSTKSESWVLNQQIMVAE
jgi:hypothetical protein